MSAVLRSVLFRPLLRCRPLHTSSIQRNVQSSNSVRQATPTELTMQIMAAANSGRFADCLVAAAKMKSAGFAPDVSVYNALMGLSARTASWLFSWAIFDDMLQSGIEPTSATFAHLIYAQRDRPYTNLWNALNRMKQLGVKPTAPVYTSIIHCLTVEGNIEMALQTFLSMKAQGMIPELAAAQAVVTSAAEIGYSRLAIEMATYFEKISTRQLGNATWIACLSSSAQNLYAEGVLACWPIVVDELNLVPTEGVCLAVLNTAARSGLPELATDVLRVLKLGEIDWQEHHFASLIEAFCRNDQLKEALMTLQIMRANGTVPLASTTSFILNCINRDIDALDSAWALIDEIHETGSGVDFDALKVIVQASIFLGDLQRAVGVYKSFPNYDHTPDVGIFNLLLQGCINAQHRQLGDILLAEMKETKIKPDKETYEKLIHLCLTQEVYEEAFFYLEEMKSAQFTPPRDVYEALGQKCLSAGDSRSDLVWEEMRECGYKLEDPRNKTIARRLPHRINQVERLGS